MVRLVEENKIIKAVDVGISLWNENALQHRRWFYLINKLLKAATNSLILKLIQMEKCYNLSSLKRFKNLPPGAVLQKVQHSASLSTFITTMKCALQLSQLRTHLSLYTDLSDLAYARGHQLICIYHLHIAPWHTLHNKYQFFLNLVTYAFACEHNRTGWLIALNNIPYLNNTETRPPRKRQTFLNRQGASDLHHRKLISRSRIVG